MNTQDVKKLESIRHFSIVLVDEVDNEKTISYQDAFKLLVTHILEQFSE